MSHFVYLYRDQNGKPRYVGYGENSERALSHMAQTHNLTLEELVKSDRFKLEVAGPFDNEYTARAVETALISALKFEGLANVLEGHAEHRFRPMGVPLEFAPRWDLPLIESAQFRGVLNTHDSPQFLCVLIKNVDFGDGRGTFDPANPPDDEKVLARVQKWWPLRQKAKIWSENPSQSPAILLGVHGKPGAQFIIASVFINRDGWSQMIASSSDSSRFEVPIFSTDLDAAELRGRRISPDAGLRFNQGGLILFP